MVLGNPSRKTFGTEKERNSEVKSVGNTAGKRLKAEWNMRGK